MKRILLATVIAVAAAMPALAQDAQNSARAKLRQACAADFQQYCAGTPAGGGARLKCLQEHNDKLSDGCKTALAAIAARKGADSGSKGSAPAPDDQK